LPVELTYRPLDAATITRGFTCGEREIDRWFARDALRDHERGIILTTCAFLPRIEAPVGFYSVATVAEDVKKLSARYHPFGGGYFPCLQMVYLAVHRAHQGRDIGTTLAGAVTALFAEIGPKIGLPHLILVPINEDVIPFYEDQLGFTCYMDRCRMYLPLQAALDAMSTPPVSETGNLFEG